MIEFLIAILFFLLGWKVRELYAVRQLSKFVKVVEEEKKQSKTVIKLEIHDDIIYAYRDSNNEFLCQSDSIEGIVEALSKRSPGEKFAVTKENLCELGLYDESV